MNQTTKAIMTGSIVATLGLAAALWMVPKAPAIPAMPVVKLAHVVVTAQRLPAAPVVKLAKVEVRASRAEVLAAQALEQGKQAAANLVTRWN
jgi:Flp pilus assembly protein CpaB